jgi:hypothetical protein
MALIECQECSNMVSSRAKNCPKCGAPITEDYDPKSTTVELTSKNLKKWLLFTTLFFIASFTLFFVGLFGSNNFLTIVGIICAIISLIGMIVTKIRIWWNHS